MKSSLGIAVAVVAVMHAVLIVGAAAASEKQKRKVGLLTAGFPWTFGPYQTQMYALSLLMSESSADDEFEYDVYWYSYGSPYAPKGVYETYEQYKRHLPTLIDAPADLKMDHLTFLGNTMGNEEMSTEKLNELADAYGLDCLIPLLDVTKVIPNTDLNIPVVAWIPLHSETVSSATVDYWVLRSYHGIASLAPSSAEAIRNAVGKEMKFTDSNSLSFKTITKLFGTVEVEFIPHIFDRKAILASADVGLKALAEYSVAEADAKLTKSSLVNRGQESTLEPLHSNSLFGKERKDDFIILLQGGNYDEMDRKGWDTSLQAFARFYKSLNDPSGVHLLVHSFESYLVASDTNKDEDAPPALMPKGVPLRFLLHELGIPRDAYTIDIARHASEVVMAYKKRADVCLHPSKVEGFGMNVMECQVVGTPVVTTKFTAMDDFTKLGRSVPNRQMIRSPGSIYDMAMPDVIGVADALKELYEEHLAMKRGDNEALARRGKEILDFNEWLDKTCTAEVVGKNFKQLLNRSYSEFSARKMASQQISSISPPETGGFEISSGYHSTIVDWDAPWTLFAPEGLKIIDQNHVHKACWMWLLASKQSPLMMVIPAKYEDGTDVPFLNKDGNINEDLPILVRSYIVTALQQRMSRRKSLLQTAVGIAGQPRILRDGMVIIERKKTSGTSHSEL